MPIQISAQLKKTVPANQRDGLDGYLWSASGGKCHLCDAPMNRAADVLVADHDEPAAEKGQHDRSNLRLAHRDCNAFKRNFPTVEVRPFLKFRRFLNESGGLLQYDAVLTYFAIKPKPCVVTMAKGGVQFELPDGTIVTAPIFQEKSPREHEYRSCYVELPREAIFSDRECQPRSIKSDHLWAIYLDLYRNPLHEAPGCRLDAAIGEAASKLLMFDGQHKTVASWLLDRQTVVAKIYLDLDLAGTIQLVNSVQAKIKKLPLSPFELSSKLSEEWRLKFESYREQSDENVSERGFLAWLPPSERARGRQALAAALTRGLIDRREELEFFTLVAKSSRDTRTLKIKEGTLKSKLLDKLLFLQPLSESLEKSETTREREQEHVIRALNLLFDLAFKPKRGAKAFSHTEQERARRMLYQSSLLYIAHLIRHIFGRVLNIDISGREFIDREPTPKEWGRIKDAIKRIVEHPVWTDDLRSTKKLRAVHDALQKNQDARKSFLDVELRVGYVMGHDPLTKDWSH